jgi:hypothetical protein
MAIPLAYKRIIENDGIPLSQINPGSTEYALPGNAALKAIDALKGSGIPILGGDVLSAQPLRYVYANWYCKKQESEPDFDYSVRSQTYAINYVNGLKPRENEVLLFVLVLGTKSQSSE